MSPSKKLTCKETFRGRCSSEFINWRYSQSCWYFRPSLWINSPPSPFPVWISILYTRIQCVCGGGGMGFWASDRKRPAAKYFYGSIFLDADILHCLLRVLYFYGYSTRIMLLEGYTGTDASKTYVCIKNYVYNILLLITMLEFSVFSCF